MIYENGIQESMENMMFFHVFPITMGFLVKFPFNQSNAKNLVVDSAIEYMMRMMGPYQLREGLLRNASYILGQLWCTILQLRGKCQPCRCPIACSVLLARLTSVAHIQSYTSIPILASGLFNFWHCASPLSLDPQDSEERRKHH